MVGLFRCVPASVPFSDLLKSWGGSVTGTYMVRLGHSTDVLIQARVLSIARVCVIAIYSTFGGNMAMSTVPQSTWPVLCSVPMGKD